MSLHRIRLLMWKEFLQLRRDPLLIRLLFLMPILQLILFGYVVAADVKNLSTAVVDLDRTSTSRALEASFGASDYFVVTQRPAETDLQHLMDTGQIAIAIVIPAGTQAALDRGEAAPIGVVVDGSDSQVASVGSGYAAQIVARFNADRLAAQGVDLAAPGIDARVRVMFNPTLASVNTMIPGLVAAILMLSIMAVMGQAVVKERERGTLEQMFVTPIKPVEYLTGKVTPYALLAVLQLTVVALPSFARAPVDTVEPSENARDACWMWSSRFGRSCSTMRSMRTAVDQDSSIQLPTPSPSVAHSFVSSTG